MKDLVALGKFSTLIIIMSIFMLVIHVQTESKAEFLKREDNCDENVCGGLPNYTTELFEGNLICHYRNDSVHVGPKMVTKCDLDCMGYEAASDQAKCMCDFCKEANFYEFFCKEPGIRTHIKEDECDTEVCTGNVKYFQFFCQAANEEHFAYLKSMMERKQ